MRATHRPRGAAQTRSRLLVAAPWAERTTPGPGENGLAAWVPKRGCGGAPLAGLAACPTVAHLAASHPLGAGDTRVDGDYAATSAASIPLGFGKVRRSI